MVYQRRERLARLILNPRPAGVRVFKPLGWTVLHESQTLSKQRFSGAIFAAILSAWMHGFSTAWCREYRVFGAGYFYLP
jgi:hypothetical protein